MAKTSTGLEENVAGLLCYVLGWITGLVFILIEKENKMVRFHALQSIIVFGAISVVSIIVSWIPFIGYILGILLSILALVLWILLMIKAYQGEKYKIPVAGDIAAKHTG
ncbi:MAG: DUF4870 domain-containing protein [Dehalococcoidia bacterium]